MRKSTLRRLFTYPNLIKKRKPSEQNPIRISNLIVPLLFLPEVNIVIIFIFNID